MTDTGIDRAAREMQRAVGIYPTVEPLRSPIVVLMHPRRQVHDDVNTRERISPIGFGTNRFNDDFVGRLRTLPNHGLYYPPFSLQRRRKVLPHESACPGHEYGALAFFHLRL